MAVKKAWNRHFYNQISNPQAQIEIKKTGITSSQTIFNLAWATLSTNQWAAAISSNLVRKVPSSTMFLAKTVHISLVTTPLKKIEMIFSKMA